MPYRNKDEKRAYDKIYRISNRERIKAKKIEWAKNNPEKARVKAESDLERWTAWGKNNKERHRANVARWQSLHPGKVRAIGLKWHRDNAEKTRAWHTKWRKGHPESVRIASQKWRVSHRDISNAFGAKYNAFKLKATPPWLTKKQYKQIEAFYVEAHRQTRETGVKYSVDHIWPLQGEYSRGLHVPWNLRVIPLRENIIKSNNIPLENKSSDKSL